MTPMYFNDSHHVFIVSGGRTGTKYFGTILSELIEDSFSVHEPDVFSGFSDPAFLSKVRDFGLYNLLIGKLVRATGIRNLSENYMGGRIDLDTLKKKIISHRKKYYRSIPEDLIIESYYGWYGCLDAVPELFRHYRILGVLRHPKTWIVSNMNWQQWFGEKDRVTRFGAGRVNPKLIGDKAYIDRWEGFSRFQKICWAYKAVYEEIYRQSQRIEHMQLVKFEDIFDRETGHEHIRGVLDFICSFEDRQFSYEFQPQIVDQRIHKNTSDQFPDFEDWTDSQKEQYFEICGDIEAKLQYQ